LTRSTLEVAAQVALRLAGSTKAEAAAAAHNMIPIPVTTSAPSKRTAAKKERGTAPAPTMAVLA
jgi:hypothetical protein